MLTNNKEQLWQRFWLTVKEKNLNQKKSRGGGQFDPPPPSSRLLGLKSLSKRACGAFLAYVIGSAAPCSTSFSQREGVLLYKWLYQLSRGREYSPEMTIPIVPGGVGTPLKWLYPLSLREGVLLSNRYTNCPGGREYSSQMTILILPGEGSIPLKWLYSLSRGEEYSSQMTIPIVQGRGGSPLK